MNAIACSLAAVLVLEPPPAGPSECPLTDNRCKAERFVQRAAAAPSSAVRAKYLEAAHGSYLAVYDESGDSRDLCAARRTFDQTLAALGTSTATPRLVPLQDALEERERRRRPRCAAGSRKAPNPPVLAGAAAVPASPPATSPTFAPAPEHRDDLLPVPTASPTSSVLASHRARARSTASAVEGAGPAGLTTVLQDAPRPADPRRPARADRRLVIAGTTTLALGLSLVGVAAYAGSQRIEARRTSLELLADAQGHATAEQTAQDLALRDTYRTMGHLALGTSLAGGAAVLVGTTLAVIGGRRLARVTRRLALGPHPGGLVFHARF